MTLEEMVKAVNEGKTVTTKCGDKVYMDLKHKHRPYIYESSNGIITYVTAAWRSYDKFEIFKEPKMEQITDKYELMELCRKWEKEGKRFLVKDVGGRFRLPTYFSYVDEIKEYRWTTIDETGHPIGEPQKFMREVKNGD